jgi:hypothetical protein
MSRPRLIAASIGVCLLAFLFPGCLTALKTVSAVYEPQTDRFRFLTVYQHIMSDKSEDEAADENWLAALYKNRENLIIVPEDATFDAWGESAIMRFGVDRWVDVPLSQSPPDGLKSYPDTIPAADITVLPGEFFLRGPGNLCYYHQVIVPGKVADATLAYLSRRIASPDKNMPPDLLDQAIAMRKSQDQPISWDEFTQQVLNQAIASLADNSSTTQPAPQQSPVQIPFDPQSLQRVHDDLLAGKLPLVRKGDQVSLTLQMTEADVAGAVQFSNTFRAGLEDQLTQLTPDEKPEVVDLRKKLGRLMASATVTAIDKTHLQLTIDLINMFNAFDDPVETNPPADNGMQEGGARMTAWAAKNLQIDQNLTIEQIEQDFKNNTLAANAPAQSVDPGTDMGQIQPATQPAASTSP